MVLRAPVRDGVQGAEDGHGSVGWLAQLAGIAVAAGFSLDDAAALSAATTAPIAQDELAADPAQVLAALKRIPNDLDYDDWIKLSAAVKAAGGEDVKSGWIEWSLSWPQNDLAGCEEKWRSLSGPFSVGASYLFERARRFGFNDAALVFSKVAGGSDQFGLEGGAELPAAGGQPTAGEGLSSEEAELRARSIGTMAAAYVYIESVEMFGEILTRELLNHRQFSARHPHVGPVKSATKNAAAVYLDAAARRTYLKRITYRPGEGVFRREESGLAFNTWRPSALVVPSGVTDSDVAPYLEHVSYLFPRGEEAAIWLDWAAAVLQRPGVKINWAPLIFGGQGIGKDMMIRPLVKGVGAHNYQSVTTEMLAASFNGWAANCVLAVVPEMHTFSRIETMDRLKPYLAAPPDELSINVKFMAGYKIPNILHMLFFTNRDDALALEADDRRFAVLHANVPPREAEYYQGFAGWLAAGGEAKVCGWLLQRDLSGFDWGARAPDTEAKDEMRRMSLSPLESWVVDGIEARTGVFASPVVSLAMVEREIPASVMGRMRPSQARVASTLRQAGAVSLGQHRLPAGTPDAVMPDSGRVSLFAVRDVAIIGRLSRQGQVDIFLKSALKGKFSKQAG